MECDRQPAHQALGYGAERLVGRQIRPGRTPLTRFDPVSGGALEASRDLLVDRPCEFLEHRMHVAEILTKWVAATERHPDRAGAKLADRGQIVRPEIVNGVERDEALDLQG